jgi:very-short-patch-repair endonuclease
MRILCAEQEVGKRKGTQMGDGQRMSPFEAIKRTTEDGAEYWSARELGQVLGYTRWENFHTATKKAREVCEWSGQQVSDHFALRPSLVELGFGGIREIEDYALSRYALHLILICGDLQKIEIRQALVYLTLTAVNERSDFRLKGSASGASFSSETALTKEQKTIGQITRAFAHLRSERQYRIPPYAVDLYFPDHKIAVECDEHGHRRYDQEAEMRRQHHLEQALECRFVRYNPDAPGFNVSDIINKIMLLVYNPMPQKVTVG